MIILIHGSDTYRSRDKLHQLQQKFRVEVDASGLNTVRIDAQELQDGQWSREVTTAPFLARRRMIVAERLLSSASSLRQLEAEKDRWWEIATSTNPESPIVVLWEDRDLDEKSAPRTSRAAPKGKKKVTAVSDTFMQAVRGVATVIVVSKLTARAQRDWITEYVRERGGSIEAQALSVIESLGIDTWALVQVLDVCLAFRWSAEGSTPIQAADIVERATATVESTLFPLQDALRGRDRRAYTKELIQALERGMHPLQILTMIEQVFFQLEQAQNNWLPASTHPFVQKKIAAGLKRWNEQKRKTAGAHVVWTDSLLKSGAEFPDLLLLRFV